MALPAVIGGDDPDRVTVVPSAGPATRTRKPASNTSQPSASLYYNIWMKSEGTPHGL